MSEDWKPEVLKLTPDLDSSVKASAIHLEEGYFYVHNGQIVARLNPLWNGGTGQVTISAPVVSIDGLGHAWYVCHQELSNEKWKIFLR